MFPQVHRHEVVEMTVEDRGIFDTGSDHSGGSRIFERGFRFRWIAVIPHIVTSCQVGVVEAL